MISGSRLFLAVYVKGTSTFFEFVCVRIRLVSQ